MSDPRNRAAAARQPLDPRMARRSPLERAMAEDLPEKKGGFTAGKAVLVILLMVVLGAGSAYVYFKASAPAVHGTIAPPAPAGSTTTPSASPSASPSGTTTPHADIPNDHAAYTVFVGSAENV